MTSLAYSVFGNNSFPNATTITFIEMPAVEEITLEEGSLGKITKLNIDSMFWLLSFPIFLWNILPHEN